MSVQTKRVLLRFLFFALIGLLVEIFFTSLGRLQHGDINMKGHTSPWMMFDYGLLGIVTGPLMRSLKGVRVPLVGRAFVYMIGIFLVELVSGWVFDMCGIHVWDYSHLPLNVHGYITLTYAPLWYLLGLFVEFLYRRVDTTALVFSLRLTAERIEEMQGRS